MNLGQVKAGMEVGIKSIPDGPAKIGLIRMGITEGTRVICKLNIPSGPVVLRYNRHEVAIGRKLAESITVE
jgi:ferrous iron transport protein A